MTETPRVRRLIAGGLVCALAYLAAAWISISLGWISSRPLYDGLTPLPPYRWVQPPAERVEDNKVPGEERFAVKLKADGSADPASVTTSDGQATVTFDLITPLEGESFDVTVTPLAPGALSPAPAGGYFDGNAYRFEAFYSGTQNPVKGSFTAVLRFAIHARQVLILRDGAWDSLFNPSATPLDQLVSARTNGMGTFVAASRGTRPAPNQDHLEDQEAPRSTTPYRWVSPPSDRAKGNVAPTPERFKLRVDSFGQTDVASVATSDGQFVTSFDFLPEQEGIKPLDVVITPLDPKSLGPPPARFYFDGNAYRLEAQIAGGSAPETLLATVGFRTLEKGSQVLFFGADGWEALPDPVATDQQRHIEARTMLLGTFAVASTDLPQVAARAPASRTALFLVAGSVVLLGAVFLARRGRTKDESIVVQPASEDEWPPVKSSDKQ